MPRTVRWLCVFALGMAAGLALSALTRDRSVVPRSVERAAGFVGPVIEVSPEAEPVAVRQLATLLPPVRYDGLALSDVIEDLRDSSVSNIFVNWPALQAAGVRRDVPVTLVLGRQTLRDRLVAVLRAVGGDHVVLDATVDADVISVSTADDLSKNVLTRVYDVRRLVRREHPKEDVAAVIRRVRGIDPMSWRAVGGSVGDVKELSGQLIVTHTRRVHDQIEEILAEFPPVGAASPGPPVPRALSRPAPSLPVRRPRIAGSAAPTSQPEVGRASHDAPQF